MNGDGISEALDLPAKLFNKDFVLLWFGQIVSSAGNSIQYIAVMWWIMQHFSSVQSGIVMGWMFAFNIIPMAALGPFAGVFADRISRKGIVVLSDALRGLIILWMAYLAYSGNLTVFWIYSISAMLGTGSAFFNPAIQSTIPNIVPNAQLTRANGMYQTGLQFTNIIGPAIGGLLVGFFGPFFVFMLNGLSYIFSAFTELFIDFRQSFRKSHEINPFFSEFKEGLKFVYSKKLIFYTMLGSSVINFVFAPIDILIAKQIKIIYGLGALELGYTVSAFAVGMIVGSVLLSALPEMKKKHNVIIISAVLTGVFLAVMGMAPNLISFLTVAFLIGFCLALVNVLFMVVLQRIIPDEKRGRAFSVITTLNLMLQPVSLALIGLITTFMSNAVIFMVAGIVVAVMSSFMYLVPGMREV